MNDKYILDGHKVKSVDLMEWSRWFETADRHVDKTDVSDDVKVSTVFVGMDRCFNDGPPLLFETMIFGGEHDQYCERFETWDQAENGHKAAVAIASQKDQS